MRGIRRACALEGMLVAHGTVAIPAFRMSAEHSEEDSPSRFTFVDSFRERLRVRTRLGRGVLTGPLTSLSNTPRQRQKTPWGHGPSSRGQIPANEPGDEQKAIEPMENRHFARTDMVFAVDCSGSTRGLVLSEEISAITKIADGLSLEARSKATVLPWDCISYPPLDVNQVGRIKSGSGTTPSVLMHDTNSQKTLRKASIWCLLTDGEIEAEEVHDFASGIAEAGLHGIPSVVILAGYTDDKPIDCNISVGKAVFALASDSLFLFHDVECGAVYLVQSKGCFNALLPPGRTSITLDDTTSWDDLPKISYNALAPIAVPSKHILSEDTVVLSSGRQLNLQAIYNNSLDDEAAHEILSDNDNLNTVLLTASTRGCKDRVKAWLDGRRFRASDPLWAARPDIGERSLKLVSEIVDTLRKDPEANIQKLSNSLHWSYDRSWQRFSALVDSREEFEQIRATVVYDAMYLLNLDDEVPHSPTVLGPVSPTLARSRDEREAERRAVVLKKPSGKDKLLYTPGYRIRESDDHYRGSCTICSTPDSILAILLKSTPPGNETSGFPAADARANHLYPMVLGAYSEMDIIAPEVYCETCSYFMTQIRRSPKSDEITGALPLVCLSYDFTNTNGALQWTETVANALQRKFNDSIVLQIFLSALHCTIDELSTDEQMTTVSDALGWACQHLVQVITIPRELIGSPKWGRSDGPALEYLQDVLEGQLNSLQEENNPLLSYPLQGFVSLIRAALHLAPARQTEQIEDAVWFRLLFTLVEQHFELLAKEDEKVARQTLSMLIVEKQSGCKKDEKMSRTPAGEVESFNERTSNEESASRKADAPVPSREEPESPAPALPIDSKRTQISLEELQQTHLFPLEVLEQYQRLGQVFPETEAWCARAIAVFLHVLYTQSLGSRNSTNLFDALRSRRSLRMVFWGREAMDQSTAADMISRIYGK